MRLRINCIAGRKQDARLERRCDAALDAALYDVLRGWLLRNLGDGGTGKGGEVAGFAAMTLLLVAGAAIFLLWLWLGGKTPAAKRPQRSQKGRLHRDKRRPLASTEHVLSAGDKEAFGGNAGQ